MIKPLFETKDLLLNRKRLSTDFHVSDFYKKFKKTNKELAVKLGLSTFNQILEEYNKLIAEDVLNGKLVKLYSGLGSLGIIGTLRATSYEDKKTGKIVPISIPDWGETRRLGLINPETGNLIVQYFQNQEYKYSIKWFGFGNILNINLTKFKTSKDFRRSIPKKLESNKTINLQYRKNYDSYLLSSSETQFKYRKTLLNK